MTFRINFMLVVGAALLAANSLVAQPPGNGEPRTPQTIYSSVRDLISEGKFDIAAEELKAFVASNPSDEDLFALQNRYGPTVFERLKMVQVWSEVADEQAQALRNVEAVLTQYREASKKFFSDPARILRYVRNLGESTEERIYAIQQLKPSGDAVVLPMLKELTSTDNAALQSGIISSIRQLGPEVVAGFLAGQEVLPDHMKIGVLETVAQRSDILSLIGFAETDPLPWLWYYSAPAVGHNESLVNAAKSILKQLLGSAAVNQPETELVKLGIPFYEQKARFATLDELNDRVTIWPVEDGEVSKQQVSKALAEEFFGLRHFRWSLDQNPSYRPAQDFFLKLAIQRAVKRTQFGPLIWREVEAYQLLAATPSRQLIQLLEEAILQKQSAEVMGFTQGLADRAERSAATPSEVVMPDGRKLLKEPVLAKALEYPDSRIQLAAALGLLRAPGKPMHGKNAQVVDVLRRALTADLPEEGAKEIGRVLIADPSDMRSDKVASFFRQLGYKPERFLTGRSLLRRIRQAADFDLIVIDNHIAMPETKDLLAQLRADSNVGNRPILLIASSNETKPVPMEHLLLRLAEYVAVTDVDLDVEIDPLADPDQVEPTSVAKPFFFDPRKPAIDPRDIPQIKKEIGQQRDRQLERIYNRRVARLRRLVEAADMPTSERLQQRLDLRIPQLTYATLAAQYPVSPESAPGTYRTLESFTRRVLSQPDLTESTVKVPIDGMAALIEQFEIAIDQETQAELNQLRLRIDPEALGIPADRYRDEYLETRLANLARYTPNVKVIPEPYGLIGFSEEIMQVTADPDKQPRTAEQKRVAAAYAVEWLRKLAVGEIVGYDVRPAEAALIDALLDDEFAPFAIDALSRIPSATVQQSLIRLAISADRPEPIRFQAADRAILHIQTFGKSTPESLAVGVTDASMDESEGELKGKLLVIHQLLGAQTKDLGELLRAYTPRKASAEKEQAEPEEPKD